MQQREKLLAIAAGGLLALVVVRWGYGQVAAMFDRRESQIAALKAAIDEEQAEIDRGKQANARLAEWEQRSLPTDLELARFHYGSWLRSTVSEAGLDDVDVGSQSPRSRGNVYSWLSYTVRGRGSLADLTEFLYRFYRANHLHQIRRMDVKPRENSSDLDLAFAIEAMVLPGADRQEKLSTEVSDRLAADDLEAYKQAIVERNFFARYVPPRPKPKPRPMVVRKEPEPEPEPPRFDVTRFAVVSSITTDRFGRDQVWIQVRTNSDPPLKLAVGDRFEIGGLKGRVAQIEGRQVVLDTEERRLLVELGESLSMATPLPQEGG